MRVDLLTAVHILSMLHHSRRREHVHPVGLTHGLLRHLRHLWHVHHWWRLHHAGHSTTHVTEHLPLLASHLIVHIMHLVVHAHHIVHVRHAWLLHSHGSVDALGLLRRCLIRCLLLEGSGHATAKTSADRGTIDRSAHDGLAVSSTIRSRGHAKCHVTLNDISLCHLLILGLSHVHGHLGRSRLGRTLIGRLH